MNTIHVLLHLYVTMAEKILFLYDLPVNTLTHLCTNDINFRAYFELGKSEITKIKKINAFHFGPKTVKIRKKAVKASLLGVTYVLIKAKKNDMKIYIYIYIYVCVCVCVCVCVE